MQKEIVKSIFEFEFNTPCKPRMSLKVHPIGVKTSVSSKELREIQKLHELGKKYWVCRNLINF